MPCVNDFEKVDVRINKVLTQYRESPKFLHLLKTYLRQIEIVSQSVCDLPDKFDIDNAEGDQLTLLGKRLGFGRCHCICETQPTFGFECEGISSEYEIAGFCNEDVTWLNCESQGVGEICINSDETYRKFLKVRIYQILNLYDYENFEKCLNIFWGNDAKILDAGHSRIVVTPGRNLSDSEIALLQLYPRVLPIALGITCRFHFGDFEIFGFGEGWGGFCEEWEPDGLTISDGENLLLASDGVYLHTSSLTKDADWMCEYDVNPYSCA